MNRFQVSLKTQLEPLVPHIKKPPIEGPKSIDYNHETILPACSVTHLLSLKQLKRTNRLAQIRAES